MVALMAGWKVVRQMQTTAPEGWKKRSGAIQHRCPFAPATPGRWQRRKRRAWRDDVHHKRGKSQGPSLSFNEIDYHLKTILSKESDVRPVHLGKHRQSL
jgi:hypothetical protein